MSESKESSLEPIVDKGVIDVVKSVVKAHHPNLAGATIEMFWQRAKPLNAWGKINTATEILWWLSAADIVLQINRALWDSMKAEGRRGLIDHFLSQVAAKSGGTTTMQTQKGERQLYEELRPSLSVHPHVIARNPGLLAEIGELRKLRQAIEEPEQFILEFERGEQEQDESEAA
jgi:hypothetical protein